MEATLDAPTYIVGPGLLPISAKISVRMGSALG
jgi:hypothetical protein